MEYNVIVYKPWTKKESDSGRGGDKPKRRTYGTKYSLNNLLLELATDRNRPSAMDYDEIVVTEVSDNLENIHILLKKDGVPVSKIHATTGEVDSLQQDRNAENSGNNTDNENRDYQNRQAQASGQTSTDNTPDENRQTTLGQPDDDRKTESYAGKQEREGTYKGQPLSRNNSELKDPTNAQNSPEQQQRKENAS